MSLSQQTCSRIRYEGTDRNTRYWDDSVLNNPGPRQALWSFWSCALRCAIVCVLHSHTYATLRLRTRYAASGRHLPEQARTPARLPDTQAVRSASSLSEIHKAVPSKPTEGRKRCFDDDLSIRQSAPRACFSMRRLRQRHSQISMAGGGVLPSGPVRVYNGHQTFYLWFCVLLGGAGGLLLGYDNGVMVRACCCCCCSKADLKAVLPQSPIWCSC